jgi:hypothetical protein
VDEPGSSSQELKRDRKGDTQERTQQPYQTTNQNTNNPTPQHSSHIHSQTFQKEQSQNHTSTTIKRIINDKHGEKQYKDNRLMQDTTPYEAPFSFNHDALRQCTQEKTHVGDNHATTGPHNVQETEISKEHDDIYQKSTEYATNNDQAIGINKQTSNTREQFLISQAKHGKEQKATHISKEETKRIKDNTTESKTLIFDQSQQTQRQPKYKKDNSQSQSKTTIQRELNIQELILEITAINRTFEEQQGSKNQI